jgi:hypothetical protein
VTIMLFMLLVLPILLLGLVGTLFLLGFRLGGDRDHAEVVRVRLEAAQAARRMHDLTRDAFVSMAEHVERRRNL